MQPIRDWLHFFKSEASKPEYGTFDKFDAVPPTYMDDIDEFKKQFVLNSLETILLIPGADKTVRLLHNCSLDNDANRVSGIFGTKRFAPMKQVAVASLVKPFAPLQSNRTEVRVLIPSVEDFKECSSGAEFSELVGSTGTQAVDELVKLPVSFWLHPHLLDAYVTFRQVNIDSIGSCSSSPSRGWRTRRRPF